MKKISVFLLVCFLLMLWWCKNSQNLDFNEDNLQENQQVNKVGDSYSWNLVIAGIWPDISFEPTVDGDTLVLKWYFEDHTDHIYFHKWQRESLLNKDTDYLPWTHVYFEWDVEFVDWAAWNHYYDVVNVSSFDITQYPEVEEINEIIESYNYCELDSDCYFGQSECPFWCYLKINKKFSWIAKSMIDSYLSRIEEKCVYSCIYVDWVKCEQNKCVEYIEPVEK